MASLVDRYDALVAQGALKRDVAQSSAVARLQSLADTLAARRAPKLPRPLASFFLKAHTPAPRGLYLHGPVGRGKTTLMNLFFEAAPVAKKRRAHFHAFMSDVHERLHRARSGAASGADPVAQVAREIAAETRLLCFDEFAVTDIADASILARLFSALFAAGLVVVATSNVEPARLYEGGRNRDLFLPFIALLQKRMDVVRLAAAVDYRAHRDCVGEVYFTPADATARAALDALFLSLSGAEPCAPAEISVKRRSFHVPRAAGRVARFSFAELCGRAHGAADYLTLCENYDAVIVDAAPRLAAEQRNEARRFITLVDVLYEAHTLLAMSADDEPAALYLAAHGAEAREFQRAVSRLTEMRARDYIDNCAARPSVTA